MEVEVRELLVERGATRAVDGVSVRIEGGRWTGLVGANGSGKTSFLRALGGRGEAAGGAILVDGVDRTGDRAWRARSFGFAPDASALPESLTGRELFSIAATGQTAQEPNGCVDALRRALAFDAFLDRRIGSLSAGMRQRLAIFCAFLNRPRLVILDEPFNWLDPVCAFDTRVALRALVNREAITLVTALHDTATLLHHCDTGLLLSAGRVARRLSADDLRRGAGDYARFETELIGALRAAG